MTFGVWLWGAITILLAGGALLMVIVAGIFFNPANGQLNGAPAWFAGLYQAVKDNGSLVAGILGFSGLAWSYFFNVANHLTK